MTEQAQAGRGPFGELLQILASRKVGVSIDPDPEADEADLDDVSGYRIDVEPGGELTFYHCYSEPHSWQGESRLTAEGLLNEGDEDDDLPLGDHQRRLVNARLLRLLPAALTAAAAHLRETSNGVIHASGAGPDRATLCAIDIQAHPVEPCEADDPTCWPCRQAIVKRWLARRRGGK